MSSDQSRLQRLRAALDRVLIAVFLLALSAPTLDQMIRPAERRSPREVELRMPAVRPWLPTNLEELSRYPRGIEAWYVDWFGLRDRFLRWDSWIKMFVFGQSPTPTVEIGRDRWMWYTGDRSQAAFRGRLPFDERGLSDWQAMLANHSRVLGELGIASLYVLGPNKETIYPEYVPPWWTRQGPTRLEQLYDWLDAHGRPGAKMPDLRPALLAAKAEDGPDDFLYYQYGTHWNGRGCYVAYREIMSALQQRFPAAAPLPPGRFTLGEDNLGDSWGRAMYLGDLLVQRRITFEGRKVELETIDDHGLRLIVVRDGDPAGPRVVMFLDSFGLSILHMLAQHCSRLVCCESFGCDEGLIARERPDLVLGMFVERVLVSRLPSTAMIGGGELCRPRFERAIDTRFRLDAKNASTALQPVGVTVSAGGEDTLATVRADHQAGYVVLAPVATEGDGDLLLHLEVDSTTAARMHVLELTACQGASRMQDAWTDIKQGANSLWLRLLWVPGLNGLILHPGQAGTYRIRALEVRQAPG